jgi:hypothetical protein
MSPENWAVIDAIAEDLNTTALTGSRAGLPSWRSMLYQLATGKLMVVQATMFANIIKDVNRLEVKPRSSGAKRHILARLREICTDHDQEE